VTVSQQTLTVLCTLQQVGTKKTVFESRIENG
jgi:hypothetical protein